MNVSINNIYFKYFILILLFFISKVEAQNGNNKYEQAFLEYEKENYKAAKNYVILFLNRESKNHRQYPYAMFLNAKLNVLDEDYIAAIQILTNLEIGFPKWENINEAILLKAECFFESNSYLSALEALQQIKNPDEDSYIYEQKNYYLNNAYFDVKTLFSLYNQTKDKDLAKILLTKLSNNPLDFRIKEQLLIDFPNLSNRYVENIEINKKDIYNLTFIAPFYTKDIQNSNLLIGNDIVIDLYLGIKKAVNKKNQESEKIKLNIIDSKADPDWVSELIKLGILDSTDAFIGPLNPDVYEVINNFSIKNRIPIINLLSRLQKRLIENSMAINVQPSFNSMAYKIPQLMQKINEEDTVKILMIRDSKNENNVFANNFLDAYETFKKDSLMLIQKNEIVNPLDYQKVKSLFYDEEKEIVKKIEGEEEVILLRRYKTTEEGEEIVEIIEEGQVLDTLTVEEFEKIEIERKRNDEKSFNFDKKNEDENKKDKEENEDEEEQKPFKLEEKLVLIPQDFNTVFVPSKNKVLIANVIAAAIAHPEPISIIGTQDWVLKSIISADQLEKLTVYLLYPLFNDSNNEETQLFRTEFLNDVNMPPKLYSYIGYDIGVLAYQLLDSYGTNFPLLIEPNKSFGSPLFKEKIFLNRENISCPIIKFNEGHFYELNISEIEDNNNTQD